MTIQQPKPSASADGVSNQNEANEHHDGASLGDTRPDALAHRAGGGRRGDEKDAPPSNTASSNCNSGYFKPLRWGVDSLYLSYPGELSFEMDSELKRLKEIAQSPEPYQRTNAQLSLDGHIFEIKDKGAPLFPYILEDNAFRIQVSRSTKMPLAYVKVSSEYLSHVLPRAAEETLRQVISRLGELSGEVNVSRVDMFVDFVSSVDMESWDRHAWVTRAKKIDAHSVDGKFSGWSIGIGGIISARLYNKTLEIEKSKKNYLHDLWKASGWDGVSPVWRLEFELKREVLTGHGLSSLESVLHNLNGLWSYCTTDWLRLALPNSEDKTRSRWPIHPLWGYLSSVDWETSGGVLSKRFTSARVPGDDKLFSMGLSMVIGYMAREGIRDLYDGLKAFEAAMYAYHESKSFYMGQSFDDYIAEKVSVKMREFNTALNPVVEKVAVQCTADEYRQRAKGDWHGNKKS